MSLIDFHRSAARMSAPNISFKTALAECIRNDLETTALFNKQPFK